MNQELRQLIEAQCDGTATVDQCDRLQQLMDEDPQVVRSYVEYLDLHAQLQWHGRRTPALPAGVADATAENASVSVPRVRPIATFFSRQIPLSLTVAALVIGLLVTAMAFMVPPFYRAITTRLETDADDSPMIVARLSNLWEAEWAAGQLVTHRGAFLQRGHRMELTNGFVELTFNSGAIVVVESPAILVVEDALRCQLEAGKIVGRIPASATGFSVVTPNCEVVDLGTEFGVHSTATETEVHVLKGRVEVSAAGQVRPLSVNQTVAVDARGIQPRAVASTTFRREVPEPARIVWSEPKDLTGPEDILIAGRPVIAINCGPGSPHVNGVRFVPGNPFGEVSDGMLNNQSTGDAPLDELLSTISYGGGRNRLLRVHALTSGKTYQVQLIYCDGRQTTDNRPMMLRDAHGNTVTLNNNEVTHSSPPFGQYVIGTFTATSDTQQISISTQAKNVHLTAYQLRASDSPEADPD